jgi:hypothetical protein
VNLGQNILRSIAIPAPTTAAASPVDLETIFERR